MTERVVTNIRAGEYAVGRPRGACVVTGRVIAPGEAYIAAVRDDPAGGLERLEFTPDAWADWPTHEKARLLAHWRTTMPAPSEARRKLLVDDDTLAELFRRLGEAETDDVGRLAFRFVLGLILMRKRLLTYEGSEVDAQGRDAWRVRFRREDEEHVLIDPKLDESQLDEVGRQVGQILSQGIEAEALAGEAA